MEVELGNERESDNELDYILLDVSGMMDDKRTVCHCGMQEFQQWIRKQHYSESVRGGKGSRLSSCRIVFEDVLLEATRDGAHVAVVPEQFKCYYWGHYYSDDQLHAGRDLFPTALSL